MQLVFAAIFLTAIFDLSSSAPQPDVERNRAAKYPFDLNLRDFLDFRMNYTWPVVNAMIEKLVDSAISGHLLDLIKLSRRANLTSSCQESSMEFILALRKAEKWAINMADASGKIPSGILDGTVMDFGSYDECIRIRANSTSVPPQEMFRGQYCMVGFNTPLLSPMSMKTRSGQTYVQAYGHPPEWISSTIERADGFLKKVSFWFGLCVPSKCTTGDIERLADIVSKPLGFTVTVSDCQVDNKRDWSTYELVSVSLLGALAIMSVIGTVIDVVTRFVSARRKEGCMTDCCLFKVFKAFSIYANTEKLLDTGISSGSLGFFHGIRFFSATWIILGHTYFYTDTWKYLKYRRLLGVTDQFNGQFLVAVIENFTVPVGSFFFMSGFLITYTNWKKMEKTKGKLNLLMFFVHKYWRMTPAHVVTIALFFVMPLLDSGPIWNSTLNPPIEVCQKTWWTNILYIHNWWGADSFCLLHTWYLGALMQFHIVAAILLLLLFRWPILGVVTGVLIVIGCSVATALLTVWSNFPMPAPGIIKDLDIIVDYTGAIYIKPYAHIATYMVGMAVGYMVIKYHDVTIRTRYQVLGWILAIMCNLSVVYGIYGYAEPVEIRAVYISLHRVGWAIGMGWLTFTCATGTGGIVTRILSWKALVPLGQLSYLAYLLHPLVILYRTATLRERVYYGHTELVYAFLAHTVVAFFLAYLCYVTVEVPFAILESMVFSRSKKSPTAGSSVPPSVTSTSLFPSSNKSENSDGSEPSQLTALSIKQASEP